MQALTEAAARAALADPTTSAQQVADIARDFPGLRALVAAHPAAFPALLDWLAGTGDPAVAAAVATRRAMDANQVRTTAPPMAPMAAPLAQPVMQPGMQPVMQPGTAWQPAAQPGGPWQAAARPGFAPGGPAPYGYGQAPMMARPRSGSRKTIGIVVGVLVVVVALVIGLVLLLSSRGPSLTVSQFEYLATQSFGVSYDDVVSGQDLVNEAVNYGDGPCNVTRQDVSVVLAGTYADSLIDSSYGNESILFLIQPGTNWTSLLPRLENCLSQAAGVTLSAPVTSTHSGVTTRVFTDLSGGYSTPGGYSSYGGYGSPSNSAVLVTYGNVGLLDSSDTDTVMTWVNAGGPASFKAYVDQAAKS